MSSASSLKLFERQKRREGASSSPAALPRSSRSSGGNEIAGAYDGYGRPTATTRRPGESPIIGGGIEPLQSARRTTSSSSKRSDPGSVRSVDSLYMDLNNSSSSTRPPAYDQSSSRPFDSSFASTGRSGRDAYQTRPLAAADLSATRDMSFRSEPTSSSSRGVAAADPYGRASDRVASLLVEKPTPSARATSMRSSNANGASAYDAYGREQPRGDRNLATWSRPALEARVETLERLLSEQQSTTGRNLPATPDDRDLAEHLQVTVRKNRELRAELEVTKNRLATLVEEREAFALKLNRDNDSLQTLLEEAQRAKEALGNCIKALSAEKAELSNRLAFAEDEIVRLRAGGSSTAVIQFDELRGNIEDVAVINEGLKESLRQMQLKNPTFNMNLGENGDDAGVHVDADDL